MSPPYFEGSVVREAAVQMCSSTDQQEARPAPKPRAADSTPKNDLGRLAFCATGICVCYLYYGVLQEKLLNGEQRLGPTFVIVTQCMTNSLVAFVWQRTTTESPAQGSLPYTTLLWTALCYVAAMTCSNEAIPYVSYPVAVLAKSCKLIPTMFVGQLVERRLYSSQEWLAALLISSGIALFQMTRMKSSSSSDDDQSTMGLILLGISLTMDGFLSSCQNWLKRASRPPSAVETMFYINFLSVFFLVPVAMYKGQWNSGMDLLWRDPSLAQKLGILNGTAAIGQTFVFLTIAWYSPVITTTITTTRKFFTILLSVWTFGHAFSAAEWTAIALVFAGLYLVILVQRQKSVATKPHTD